MNEPENYAGYSGERLRWVEQAIETTRKWMEEANSAATAEIAFSRPGGLDYDLATDLKLAVKEAETTLQTLEAEKQGILARQDHTRRDVDAGRYDWENEVGKAEPEQDQRRAAKRNPESEKFPREDVLAALADHRLQTENSQADLSPEMLQTMKERLMAALKCGASEETSWIYFRSPPRTWEHLCGREGWLLYDPHSGSQYDFLLTLMNRRLGELWMVRCRSTRRGTKLRESTRI